MVLGAAADTQPVYAGADAYRVQGGPVIDIEYRDIAFLSTGDGLGVNFLRGDHYRVGAAIAYDRGRLERDDLQPICAAWATSTRRPWPRCLRRTCFRRSFR